MIPGLSFISSKAGQRLSQQCVLRLFSGQLRHKDSDESVPLIFTPLPIPKLQPESQQALPCCLSSLSLSVAKDWVNVPLCPRFACLSSFQHRPRIIRNYKKYILKLTKTFFLELAEKEHLLVSAEYGHVFYSRKLPGVVKESTVGSLEVNLLCQTDPGRFLFSYVAF